MIRRPPRSTQGVSSAASDVYKRQVHGEQEMNTGSKDIVVRVFSPAGRSRIEISSSANYGALCAKISEHLKISASGLQLYKDEKYRTKLTALSSYSLVKAGITDGIILYVQNAGAKIPIAGQAPPLSLIHISEPTRPLYISYAVFCLKKKKSQQ
eukprot:TRINITY_DN26821_c0_g1_i5.p2 TRINITY_DN26821_c0_g1~~TRINITY_DN26821_c0_g1_i5.p2  ORF type:complete len:154 (+),score=23.63 TRINITY_DN26821_c0_g1_i5:89-550(+)